MLINCLFFRNPLQCDVDKDGKGNDCDEDIDNDGKLNNFDNCILVTLNRTIYKSILSK